MSKHLSENFQGPSHFFDLSRIKRALFNTLSGLSHISKHEIAFQQNFFLLLVGSSLCFVVPFKATEIQLILLAHISVLTVETLNTAIEAISDRITLERDDQIKIIKDLGSAAVFLSLVALCICWLMPMWRVLH